MASSAAAGHHSHLVITHLEPDILECEVKWALGSITIKKASGGDGIPVDLFQILKDPTRRVPSRGTPRVPAPLPLSPFSPPDRDRITRKFETSHVGGATGRTPPIPRSAVGPL